MKPYTQSIKTIFLALMLSFGISFVYAWTGPTTTPPAGNTSAPINTSADSQYKNGALGVGGILKGYSGLNIDSASGIAHVYSGYNDGTRDYGIYQWQDVGATPFNYFQNNVGIGTATPGAKLEVAGNVKISGDLIDKGYKFVFSPIITYGEYSANYLCCGGGSGHQDTCNGDEINAYTCSGNPKTCIDVVGVADYWSCGYCGKVIYNYRNIDCGTTASVSANIQ